MAIVVKSDFWSNNYAFIRSKSSLRKVIARILNQKSMRSDRELVDTLLGTAAGSAALAQMKRVAHSTTELGGIRTIETQDLVNRNTTSGDDSELTSALLTYNSQPTYPTDKARLS